MQRDHDDEELDFEWKDEDEDEIAGESSNLAKINPLARAVFLLLLGIGFVYFVLRVIGALTQAAG